MLEKEIEFKGYQLMSIRYGNSDPQGYVSGPELFNISIDELVE